jgi:DNA-binding CsgD family transcriptional regulator
MIDDYQAYYWQRDLWAIRATELGMSKLYTSKELIADKALEETEFHQDWVRRLDIFYVVGSTFQIAEGQIGIYGTHRPRGRGNYEQGEVRPILEFVPHLRRALQIRQRLGEPHIERDAGLEGLQRTGTAILVVGEGDRLLYANAQAEALLRSGETVRVIHGRLATSSRPTSDRLAALISGAIATAMDREGASGGGAVALHRKDRLPLTILVAPFRPVQKRGAMGAPVPAAILFVRDPELANPSIAVLQDLFGFTPAEACLASALAQGRTIEDFLASHHVTLNTVRTQLKAIFAKTRTRRQAELVSLILRSVWMLAPK